MNPTKKLLILGAGESGVGAALLGKKQGWDVFVSDGGALQKMQREELETNGIAFEENGHRLENLSSYTLAVKSPGIPEKAPSVQRLRQVGISIVSEIEFAFRYIGDSRIIAITGSNGKSTTTKLVYHLLKSAGYGVSLVGNIGISLARQMATNPTQWYALEVSSFQLDDIETFRPDIAVVVNITPDHLDRYNYKLEQYAAAKMRISENQTSDDLLIVNADDALVKSVLKHLKGQPKRRYFSLSETQPPRGEQQAYVTEDTLEINTPEGRISAPLSEISIQGKHNYYNALAASMAALAVGISPTAITSALATFEGLEHRMEECGTINGVRFINDSKATNVDSVWYALDSMTQPVVLILGGQDKGNDYSRLLPLVAQKVKAIVCMGLDNRAIHTAFGHLGKPVMDTESAAAAVGAAMKLATAGEVVLLSPACASFDLFKNYEDRGRQFKKAVRGHLQTFPSTHA